MNSIGSYKFSIILPVKNGGEYLKECVNSILSQTYTSFDFIILENASTDDTLSWLKTVKDTRIKIFSSRESLSIEENWARILEVQKNEFITLIGHDDILDPHYLETMNELINQYPDASLYQTHFRFIDSAGQKIRSCKPMEPVQSPYKTLSHFLANETDIIGTGFMMRARDYDAIGGIPAYPSLLFADFELWTKLAGISYMAVSPRESFAFRIHQSTTTTSTDIKMVTAFSKFIDFLYAQLQLNKDFAKAIHENAESLLDFYCQGFTSRILRTPVKNRQGLTVNAIVDKFKVYAGLLLPGKKYQPETKRAVKIASLIDRSALGRNLFLLFKKIYNKPILR